MTADAITIDRVLALHASIESAAEVVNRIYWETKRGEVDPAKAAEAVNELVAAINEAAR